MKPRWPIVFLVGVLCGLGLSHVASRENVYSGVIGMMAVFIILWPVEKR